MERLGPGRAPPLDPEHRLETALRLVERAPVAVDRAEQQQRLGRLAAGGEDGADDVEVRHRGVEQRLGLFSRGAARLVDGDPRQEHPRVEGDVGLGVVGDDRPRHPRRQVGLSP